MIPPPVLPAHAPKNISPKIITFENSGQRLKSTVLKPVVEIKEATVKNTCLMASPTELKDLYTEIVIKVTADKLKSGNTKSCGCLHAHLATKNLMTGGYWNESC